MSDDFSESNYSQTDTKIAAVNCTRDDFAADDHTLEMYEFFVNNDYDIICPHETERHKMRLKNFKESIVQESYEFRIERCQNVTGLGLLESNPKTISCANESEIANYVKDFEV